LSSVPFLIVRDRIAVGGGATQDDTSYINMAAGRRILPTLSIDAQRVVRASSVSPFKERRLAPFVAHYLLPFNAATSLVVVGAVGLFVFYLASLLIGERYHPHVTWNVLAVACCAVSMEAMLLAYERWLPDSVALAGAACALLIVEPAVLAGVVVAVAALAHEMSLAALPAVIAVPWSWRRLAWVAPLPLAVYLVVYARSTGDTYTVTESLKYLMHHPLHELKLLVESWSGLWVAGAAGLVILNNKRLTLVAAFLTAACLGVTIVARRDVDRIFFLLTPVMVPAVGAFLERAWRVSVAWTVVFIALVAGGALIWDPTIFYGLGSFILSTKIKVIVLGLGIVVGLALTMLEIRSPDSRIRRTLVRER
jgi:hypothetical protein